MYYLHILCAVMFYFLGGSCESGGGAHGGSCWESKEATWQKCSSAGRSQEADPAAGVLQQQQRSQSITRFLILRSVLFCCRVSIFDRLLVVMLQTQRTVTTDRGALSRYPHKWLIAPSNNWSTSTSSLWSAFLCLSLFLPLEQWSSQGQYIAHIQPKPGKEVFFSEL